MDNDFTAVEKVLLLIGGIVAVFALWRFATYLVVDFYNSDVVELKVEKVAKGDKGSILLPPTDGDIKLSFRPDAAIAVTSGAEPGPDKAYTARSCAHGCTVEVEVVAAEPVPVVKIEYLMGDSEYLNDITIDLKTAVGN